MNKKVLLIMLLGIILTALYLFALSWVTSTYPPIKEYSRTETLLVLDGKLFSLFHNKEKYQHFNRDTIYYDNTRSGNYVDIEIKINGRNYKYLVRYFKYTSIFNKDVNTKVELIGAFDMTDNFGGYKMEVDGMKNLVKIFDKEFIAKLE